MDFTSFHQKFQQAAIALNSQKLEKKKLRVAVVDILDSVVLKLYKNTWANADSDPLTAPTRIFFAIWVNDKTLSNDRMYYNIHALKLQHLKGYAIESKKFADSFRTKFREFENEWPNVRADFGPLTLMEGWQSLTDVDAKEVVAALAIKFMTIDYLIDDTLTEFGRMK